MEVKELFDEKLSRRGLLKGAAAAAGSVGFTITVSSNAMKEQDNQPH